LQGRDPWGFSYFSELPTASWLWTNLHKVSFLCQTYQIIESHLWLASIVLSALDSSTHCHFFSWYRDNLLVDFVSESCSIYHSQKKGGACESSRALLCSKLSNNLEVSVWSAFGKHAWACIFCGLIIGEAFLLLLRTEMAFEYSLFLVCFQYYFILREDLVSKFDHFDLRQF